MSKIYHTNIPASYVFLFKENKVLLLQRANTGYQDGKYSTIAGHVDSGETFTQCIIREAGEEAGVDLNPKDIKVAHIMHRLSDENQERIDTFFVATKWEGQVANKEPNKCSDLSWFELDKLPNQIIPYINHALTCIRQDVFYSEFGW